MDPTFRSRILLSNPWLQNRSRFSGEVRRRLPQRFVPRRVDTAGLSDRTRARLVVGPRQSGKSTFVWSLLADREPGEVLYLDAEEPTVQEASLSAVQFLADLATDLPGVRTVFIDEAQRLPEAGLFVKGLVDARRDLDVWATGSSSFHLAARTRESLAGRAVRRVLLPFSLDELRTADPAVPIARQEEALRICARQQVLGGYPAAWFDPDPERTLSDLVEAFVIRDASDRFRIQRTDAFRRLLQLAAGQVGQMVNLSEWASILGVAASTVREHLALLEESWIVKLLPAFSGGKRREITTAHRIHFYDMGLRNALLGSFGTDIDRRPDRGALAEGWALGEIAKTVPFPWTVHYWRAKGGAEMDFVLGRGNRIVGVEVKSGPRPGPSRSARSFIDAYEPACVILAAGPDAAWSDETSGRTRILTVPLHDLAVAVRAAIEVAG